MADCVSCGQGNAPDARFCDRCGTPMGVGGPPVSPHSGRGAAHDWSWDGHPTVFAGTGPDNHLILSAPGVAPYHALAWLRHGAINLISLDDTGPTFVDGQPVPHRSVVQIPLTPGGGSGGRSAGWGLASLVWFGTPQGRGSGAPGQPGSGAVSVQTLHNLLLSRESARSFLVGRASHSHLVCDAPVVSSTHLLVTLGIKAAGGSLTGSGSAPTLTVTDLGSSNGTWLTPPTDGSTYARSHRLPLWGPEPIMAGHTLYLGSYRLPGQLLFSRFVPGDRGRWDQNQAQAQAQDRDRGGGLVTGGGLAAAAAGGSPSLMSPTLGAVLEPGKPLVLGRDPQCDLVIPYPQVSSRHARLVPLPDGNWNV